MFPDGPPWRPSYVLITCEHAGRKVPPPYRSLFKHAGDALRSHRGSDHGAFDIALQMATQLSAPILFTTTTRLLIDTNRSLDHPQLFSALTCHLRDEERCRVIAQHYTPHRTSVQTLIAAAINSQHRVLHVAVHSFTDVLDGAIRELDLGLLFDPDRASEASLCHSWSSALCTQASAFRHRLNEPYQGVDDGLTSALRLEFSAHAYAGIEVEVRQGMIARARQQRMVADLLSSTLAPLVQGHNTMQGASVCPALR